MTALPDLVNPGTPVEAEWGNDVITALNALISQMTSITPLGAMIPYGGDTAPSATWLLARGTSVSKTTYSALYAVYADKFGVGRPAPPAGEFWLPDMRGQVPVGMNPGGTYAASVGIKEGAADAVTVVHSHTTPNHYHDMSNHAHYTSGTTHAGGDHVHLPGGPQGQFMTVTVNPSGIIGSGGAQLAQIVFVDTTAASGPHAHGYDAWSGAPNINTTGWATATGTDNSGVSGTLKNLQPGCAVNYIIRAL